MKAFIAVVLVIILLTGVFIFFKPQINQVTPAITSPPPSSILLDEKTDIKASFKIITNGTMRIFIDSKYHNKSADVYIQLPDPGIVYVTKKGITWDDFFKTLPMKLTKDCLTTGTDQLFCAGDVGTLRFYLNDVEDKDLLDKVIKDGERILIEFK